MTRLMAKITHNGVYRVEFHSTEKFNPYRVYIEFYDYTHHKKLLEKFADLESCIRFIADHIHMNL